MASVPASKASGESRPSMFQWAGFAQLLRPAQRQSTTPLTVPELVSLDGPCPLTLPAAADLPGDAASLTGVGTFIERFDPTRHFRERWGERYRPDIEALWHNCVSAYRGSGEPIVPPGELLLCLAYDWRLGPFLGISEHEKLAFLRWLIAQMRARLSV
jgi:hypothetical protein